MVYYVDFSQLDDEDRIEQAEPAALLPVELGCAAHEIATEIHNLGLLPFDIGSYSLKVKKDKETVDIDMSELKEGDVIEVHGTEGPKVRVTESRKRAFRVRMANARGSVELDSRNVIMSDKYMFVRYSELDKFREFGGHEKMYLGPQNALRFGLIAACLVWWSFTRSLGASSAPLDLLVAYLAKATLETDIVGIIRLASWFVWDNRTNLASAIWTMFAQTCLAHYIRDVAAEAVYTVACVIQHTWRWGLFMLLTFESRDESVLSPMLLMFGCMICEPVRVQLLKFACVLTGSDSLYGAAPRLGRLVMSVRNYMWTIPVGKATNYVCRKWDDAPGYLYPVYKLTQLMLLVPLSLIPDIKTRLT